MNDADKSPGRLKRLINEMPHDVALILKERHLSERMIIFGGSVLQNVKAREQNVSSR